MYVPKHCERWRAPAAAVLAAIVMLGLFFVLPFINRMDAVRLERSTDREIAASVLAEQRQGGAGFAIALPGAAGREAAGRTSFESSAADSPVDEAIVLMPLSGDDDPSNSPSLTLQPQVFDASELDFAPVVLHRAVPEYPVEFRRQGVEGRVEVTFRIDEEGRVLDLSIGSSTNPEFADAVSRAVLLWRFMPGTVGGKRVPFKMSLPVRFSIGENAKTEHTVGVAAFEL
jgi:protein TonB